MSRRNPAPPADAHERFDVSLDVPPWGDSPVSATFSLSWISDDPIGQPDLDFLRYHWGQEKKDPRAQLRYEFVLSRMVTGQEFDLIVYQVWLHPSGNRQILHNYFQAGIGRRRGMFSRAYLQSGDYHTKLEGADAVRAFGLRNAMLAQEMVRRLRELAAEGGVKL